MRGWIRPFLSVAVAGLASVARSAVSTETVTTVGFSTYPLVAAGTAISAKNSTYVVFFDTGTSRVRCARSQVGGSTWTVTDVSSEASLPFCDLAVGSDNVAHVAYYRSASPAALMHARQVNDTWVSDTVDVFDSTAPYLSLAMDSASRPWIAYNRTPTGNVGLVKYNGTSWASYESVSSTGGPCALGLDLNGLPRLFLVNDLGGRRYLSLYFWNAQGTLQNSVAQMVTGGIASPLREVRKVGLAIDAQNTTHLSYFDEQSGGLTYAQVAGASINVASIDSLATAGTYSDIAVDRNNHPMIVYFSTGVGAKSAVYNVSWTTSTIETGALTGIGSGVAFNRFGHFLAAYMEGSTGNVKWATDIPRGLSVSGVVTDYMSTTIPDVTLTLSGQLSSSKVVLSTTGFSFDGLVEGSYTITPSKEGYSFTPLSRSYNPLSSTVSGADFVGGQVGLSIFDGVFNPAVGEKTSISYSVLPGAVKIRVATRDGVILKTLVDEVAAGGLSTVLWDGRDQDGRLVASGVYLVLFETSQVENIGKVVVIK